MDAAAPVDFRDVGAIVSIKDSGQTKFHTIALSIEPAAGRASVCRRLALRPTLLAGDKPIGDIRLGLPAAYDDVCVGGKGRFLVFASRATASWPFSM